MSRKKHNFTHEFIGEGQEEMIDIFQRLFVRYVNEQKGYSYLKLKSNLKNVYPK